MILPLFYKLKRLQDEIKYLTSELNAITNAFAAEQNRSQDLSAKLDSLEKDLRFKIDVLGSELASERGKTNIDISSLDTRIQAEYADRLKDELKILRKMYEEHMRVSEETLKMTYGKKVSDLEVELAVQMNAVKPTEDVTELKIELEKYRKKIEELDSNNRDLSLQWSKLSVELKERESAFNAKMSAKEIEMAYMVKQNAEYKKMYEEMRNKLLNESSEVKVYNRLITPEVDRIQSRYSEQFGNGVISSAKKSFKFSHSSNGQMGGDSSGEESSKSIKMSQNVSKTSTAQKVSKETIQTSASSTGSGAAKKN